MNEKGQIQLVFAGILFLAVIFGAGWLIGQTTCGFADIKPHEIEISQKTEVDGEIHTSIITVNNCASMADSTTDESRSFEYQQLLNFTDNNSLEVEIQNAIALRLQSEKGFENGRTETADNRFHFESPAGKITIHTVEWHEKLIEGIATYRGNSYKFSYPVKVDVHQTSRHQTCP